MDKLSKQTVHTSFTEEVSLIGVLWHWPIVVAMAHEPTTQEISQEIEIDSGLQRNWRSPQWMQENKRLSGRQGVERR